MQVFSRPTYDRIAKHILCNDESVRIDILKCFTGINSIVTAKQLDSHYNPFDTLSDLRAIVHSYSAQTLIQEIKTASNVELLIDNKKKNKAPLIF